MLVVFDCVYVLSKHFHRPISYHISKKKKKKSFPKFIICNDINKEFLSRPVAKHFYRPTFEPIFMLDHKQPGAFEIHNPRNISDT